MGSELPPEEFPGFSHFRILLGELIRCQEFNQTLTKDRTVLSDSRQKAYAVAKTPQFAEALRKRRKVEALFSELKNLVGLRRLRLRRIKFVREQFYLAAVPQNLKRLVRFLTSRPQLIQASN